MKKTYKIIRTVLFSLILTLAGLYALMYIGLSLPVVQNWIKGVIESEFNKRSDGRLEIGSLSVSPFSEAILTDVRFISPQGEAVVKASKVGAGINITRLIFSREVEITYAELIGLDARIVQPAQGAPLNFSFIIDAFKSRKPKKEPTRFDLELDGVVIRRGHITFDRAWLPRVKDSRRIDFNHLELKDIAADLRSPRLKNDDFTVDLRRLSFKEAHSLTVDALSGRFHVTDKEFSFNDLRLRLPSSQIVLNDMTFRYNGYKDMVRAFRDDPLTLRLYGCRVTPADFRAFLPELSNYSYPVRIDLDATRRDGTVAVRNLRLTTDRGLSLHLRAHLENILSGGAKPLKAEVPLINFHSSAGEIASLISDFSPLSKNVNDLICRLGDIDLHGRLNADADAADFEGNVTTGPGALKGSASLAGLKNSRKVLKANIVCPGIDLGAVSGNRDFGFVSLEATIDASLQGKEFDGKLTASVPEFNYLGNCFTDFSLDAEKRGKHCTASLSSGDSDLDFDIDAELALAGAASRLFLEADVRNLDLRNVTLPGRQLGIAASGYIHADITGNSPDNFLGSVSVEDLSFSDFKLGNYSLNSIEINATEEEGQRHLQALCDYGEFDMTGRFRLTKIPGAFWRLLQTPLPDVTTEFGRNLANNSQQNCRFRAVVYKDSPLWQRIKLPVTLLEDFEIGGSIDTEAGTADVSFDVPYLQQGRDKLLRDIKMSFTLDNMQQICNLHLSGRMPDKSGGYTTIAMESNAAADRVDTDLRWIMPRERSYCGNISLTTQFSRPEGRPVVDMTVNPSHFEVNDTVWDISQGSLHFTPGELSVKNVKVSRPGQSAVIHGVTTALPGTDIQIALQNIDLDYVFDTLNINYVIFGGTASGTIRVSELFSSHPKLYTDDLEVKKLTYNHSLLGDAKLSSFWDNDEKAVRLNADIRDGGRKVANVNGAIWAMADSLSFDCNAEKVNVGFLKPFMSAFCDDVEGHATGHAKLYGNFHDIDLIGKVYADNVRMKIGVTNTWYSASDTVELKPGLIELDNITLYDREGHSAKLNGYVTHEYFHNPTFKFNVTDAKNLLVYDTNKSINPIWYGTIYANGSGNIVGVPGFIDILVDMTTAPGSTFTFVLDDAEEAIDYEFLTFSDRRKEEAELKVKEELERQAPEPDFVKEFQKRKEKSPDLPTKYRMDLRVTATPDAQAVIVMDPIAGDRIRAYGSGPLRLTYNSEDEMELFGTYTLQRGDYNFTLQEVIVRDFKIREGSKITFTGDPLNASLDITAAYRVNTSLTDLDKSFGYDYDLNRNNVPVEALLKVSGPMQSPEIDFDIDLPTLNRDVVRKVKSIVSTQDMMNMQMVYLLALNRFYTPDYMNNGQNNNEMASLASATVSTQLTNILGQLSDKWSFAPSFRTDKGDFSDTEFDLALSSNLLNNRLLLNGNLGYRDKATSSTTFVGDFDIEYLLNKSGSLRLKAYNHYNDQNYYLRSALTTQGIGIVYKRDFNRFLPGLFRRKKKDPAKEPDSEATAPKETTDPKPEPKDSIAKKSDWLQFR